jgi:threonine aldolase
MIDLQSDTRTKPFPAMYQQMASAELGDDCYGDDKNVNKLEKYVAQLLGKESAVLTCSGTMSNQIAILSQTNPGDEIITDQNYHVAYFESAATSRFCQVNFNMIHSPNGIISKELFCNALETKPRQNIYSQSKLLILENTIANFGGRIFPLSHFKELSNITKQHGLSIHLDGARLLNAHIATGIPLHEYGDCVDTISICLSKGLAAPFGSILTGSKQTIDKARRYRKMLGGGMHQVGIMAAAALWGIQNYQHIENDHINAQSFYKLIKSELPTAVAHYPETNIVFMDITQTKLSPTDFCKISSDNGLKLFPWTKNMVRAIFHKDITASASMDAAKIFIQTYQNQLEKNSKQAA